MESLLVNLRKYRPRENNDPLENFLTEAFAWLLRSNREVLQAVLECINNKLQPPINVPDGDVFISTQENFNNKFPDLVISWHDCTLVFEHKVNSPLHLNQLQNYREYALKTYDNHKIILITATSFQHAQKPDAALCWEEIYKCLIVLADKINDEHASWAIEDFLSLLKSEGLGPKTPMNRFSIANYLEAVKFSEQVDSIFKEAQKLVWPLQSIGMEPVFKRQGTESRVGLEFCPTIKDKGRQWLPGIFCGVLLDGADHGVKNFTNNELKLCLVFDFNRTGQETIKHSENYKKFKEGLKSFVNDWEYIDTAVEPNAKHNKWHPIIILKPMLPLFESTNTHQEQVNIVLGVFSELQKNLIERPEFIKLVEELTVTKSSVTK
ncbi:MULTISPECIES: PD-(D/E)XK nuclease family protein [unclassified Pseudoalteromonas]|jgi:hypothetical protein|uniref:PD-(D/E)XK nuclease family protein n=1 Tax=unclassified Pseudoalteromonas TaxID=194690 RepID=UPI00040FA93F|nr:MULTISPECIES: PD-(D/E)XK nuclease family protein [unclassified Pseudoalteromonas]MBH0001162.1 PD-(D/E)XK nuclease family protein [Pseudoalteromonas sp. SWYJZ12]MBH0017819.1 PD-(D/E)XK nuclease family protein [Pseudoalteromonas sp. NGC95]MDN3390658.1 PD-(D/E)XK nuclease family protein [Pseudoalteromonas sp. APC 3691]